MMPKFEKGDVVEVKSELVEFACAVEELLSLDVIKEFEDCVAVYLVHWEGAENPDVEPKITLWEYTNGDVYASDDSVDGFEYHEVSATKGELT
jgi:hypothetical protein